MPNRLAKDALLHALRQAVASYCGSEGIAFDASLAALEPPRDEKFGDYATNVALQIASRSKRKPRDVAAALVKLVLSSSSALSGRGSPPLVAGSEVAGPGFINFTLDPCVWVRALAVPDSEGDRFGHSEAPAGTRHERIQVEFVSANPTGPLHVGHGRNAVVGDICARLLAMTGHDVKREFYVNDAGKQMMTIGRSVAARMREQLGEPVAFPEDGYPGDYVKDVARQLLASGIDPRDESPAGVRRIALAAAEILKALQRKDLDDLNVPFDEWFSETPLHEKGAVAATIADMRARGHIYDADGAIWFRSTAFGDEKDRVVVRSNGEETYFAADMAYHRNKFVERSFDRVINVWGADHHGYIPRMKAIVSALGKDPAALEVVLVQFVNLTGGRMGKRTGNMVTLREVIDEVGRDAARFFFMLRSHTTALEFDLDLAKRETSENPVYYVQYGHARIASILAKAALLGHTPPPFDERIAETLSLPEEIAIAKRIADFPAVILGAARAREPHRLAFYLMDLVGAFHSYYTKYKNDDKVISDDAEKTRARLFLLNVLRRVLANGLTVVGVAAPLRM